MSATQVLMAPSTPASRRQSAQTSRIRPWTPRCTQSDHDVALGDALRSRPLAMGFPGTPIELQWRQNMAQFCIEGCYRDRIEPTLGEIQRRLVASGWTIEEAQMVPLLCARQPDVFAIEAPSDGNPCCIMLRETPHWFTGWVDESVAYSPETWEALRGFLTSGGGHVALAGGVSGAASTLKEIAPPGLGGLALGELRELIRRAVVDLGMLNFVGDQFCPRSPTTETVQADSASRSSGKRIFTVI